MAGIELERESGCGVVLGDDDVVVTFVGDQLARQRGVDRASALGSGQSTMRWCRRPCTRLSSHRAERRGSMQAADFYTGIVAELYGPLKNCTQTPGPYARFIDGSGQPALELGCGDGEPLLDLRRAGLDVDGVDSSQDMLDRCQAIADREHLEVSLYCQPMQDLQLPRRYRSIFPAGPTINLLPDDDMTLHALRCSG